MRAEDDEEDREDEHLIAVRGATAPPCCLVTQSGMRTIRRNFKPARFELTAYFRQSTSPAYDSVAFHATYLPHPLDVYL